MRNESPKTFPTNEDIAKRAYDKYLERGCIDGFDREDWVAAEHELLTEHHDQLAAPDFDAHEPARDHEHA